MVTLPANVSVLSAAEKLDLLDALWADLEAQPLSLTESQADELDRRIAAYQLNPDAVVPWSRVKAEQPNR